MGKHWGKAWKERVTRSAARRWRAKYDAPMRERRRARRRRWRLLLVAVALAAALVLVPTILDL